MVSTLKSPNLEIPNTPTNIKLIPETNTSALYTTPEILEGKADDEPKTPYKESLSKKKCSRIGSKRKLFLQSGTPGKVKKLHNPTVNKPRKTISTDSTSPTIKSTSPSGAASKEAAWPTHPLTERQQLQYLLEVTAKDAKQQSQESDSDESQGQIFTRLKKKDAIKRESHAVRVIKRNERGETPLHLAAIKGDIDDTIALIAAGIVVNTKDYAGWTPLHEACNFGHLKIVEELIKSGANVNVPGYEDISPLHDAVINNHVQVVELLLKYGANPEQKTVQGYTSIDLARSASILELLQSAKPSLEETAKMDPPSLTPNKNSASSSPWSKSSSCSLDTVSAENGCVPDQSPVIQAVASKPTCARDYDLNTAYSRRSSSSCSSHNSDADDSIDPTRLNECLDKAMLQMSSYLDPKEYACDYINQASQKRVISVSKSSVASAVAARSKFKDDRRFSSTYLNPKHLISQQNGLVLGQAAVNENKNLQENGDLNRETSSEVTMATTLQNNDQLTEKQTFQIDQTDINDSNKENQPQQRMYCQQNKSTNQNPLDEEKILDAAEQPEDCVGHIKNPSWREAIAKHYYHVSSLPLFVPGYDKFMMKKKSYTLQAQDIVSVCLYQRNGNKDDELSRLIIQQQVEREKIRLCVEQEIVRLFGKFARMTLEKDTPFGACTILKQQMIVQGRENPKSNKETSPKLSGQSIKADVEKILQKFEKLKKELLNRQRHEFDAIRALQQLGKDKLERNFVPTYTQQQSDWRLKDFELLPSGFNEYYDEFLSLID